MGADIPAVTNNCADDTAEQRRCQEWQLALVKQLARVSWLGVDLAKAEGFSIKWLAN
jgi:hypothetical protein